MMVFFRKPDVAMYPGIVVNKDTKLKHRTKTVNQYVENLILHNRIKRSGDGYESVIKTTVQLYEGDVLLFDEEKGYFKPVEKLCTVEEAIEDLVAMKELMENDT